MAVEFVWMMQTSTPLTTRHWVILGAGHPVSKRVIQNSSQDYIASPCSRRTKDQGTF